MDAVIGSADRMIKRFDAVRVAGQYLKLASPYTARSARADVAGTLLDMTRLAASHDDRNNSIPDLAFKARLAALVSLQVFQPETVNRRSQASA